MRSAIIMPIMALSVLLVCCANTPSKKTDTNTPTDVRSFGLVGNVKDISVTVTDLSDAEPTSWQDSTQYMKFDDNGRVLKDRYDNLYKYDDKGNFIYGLSEKSKMRRDEKGRIVYYENRMDEEDDQGFTLKFEYDENGRMVKTERTGWESTVDQTFTYTGDHIYPDRINLESEDEGDHYSTVITYNYKKFDNSGNWTEREIHSVCKHTIDGELEDTTDSKSIEKREIQYYR